MLDVGAVVNGSADAYTVIVVVPAGVAYGDVDVAGTPVLQAINPLAEIPSRATAISMVIVAQAPRIQRRRAKKSSNPVMPPSHQTSLLPVLVCGGWSTAMDRFTIG